MNTCIVDNNLPVVGPRRTKDGFLTANVSIARTGIYNYSGGELGRPELGLVKIYRSESEVFDQASMASFCFKPVTIGHPTQDVDATNWKQLAAGTMGSTVARDGDHVKVDLVLMDAEAIQHVEAGTRELSAGYRADIVWVPGITPGGENYHGVMRGIRGNHLAIVPKGRAGSACRIGDVWPSEGDNTNMTTNLHDSLAAFRAHAAQREADKQGYQQWLEESRAAAFGQPVPARTAAASPDLGNLSGYELSKARERIRIDNARAAALGRL